MIIDRQQLSHGLSNSASPSGDGHAPLERSALLDRFDGDADLLRDIADTFLTHCPSLMSEVRDAVTARDPARLRQAAHSLKGSVANFGAEEVVDAASRLERMGIDGGLDEADAVCAELLAKLRTFEVELGQAIDGMAA